jgi:cytochrome c biogenesis protein CcmG, thiol:disulfide interchange protein DsbE
MRRTLVIAVGVVVLVLGGAVLAIALTREDPPPVANGPMPFSERPAPDERAPLPEHTLDGFAGGEAVALADYRGRPLVLNFWASWCVPCVEEMPAFQQVAGELDGEVAFLGVDTRDAPRSAERFVDDLGITYDLAVDRDSVLASSLGVFGLPTTLFVDSEGTIVYRATSPLDAEGLRAALREHLGVDTA